MGNWGRWWGAYPNGHTLIAGKHFTDKQAFAVLNYLVLEIGTTATTSLSLLLFYY